MTPIQHMLRRYVGGQGRGASPWHDMMQEEKPNEATDSNVLKAVGGAGRGGKGGRR